MSQPTNNDLLKKLSDVSALAASGIPSYGTSEVTSLRKAGKIDEAYQKAKERITREPENLWAKRDMSWVLYSYLKANTALEKFDEFVGYLKELDELKLPEDEVMLFDQVGWQIGKMIFALLRQQNPDIKKIKSVFDYAKNFHYIKPSEGYSFLFKAFHKAFKEGPDYIPFAEWWNFNNFREEDYKKEKLPSGKDVISIAEQAIIAYVKHLLPEQTFQGATVFKKEKALSFLPFLDRAIETHPQLQYPPYFKAKLLLASGDQENMLSALLPFAKKKQNEFWVWDVMAEAFPDDEQKRLACYCRALLCNASDDFLVNIRQKMAKWFIEQAMYAEAKTEIELFTKARTANQWKIPGEVTAWLAQPWYQNTRARQTNEAFYQQYLPLAEQILYADTPVETIVIDFVNSDKKMANFIKADRKIGFFKYDRFFKTLSPGNILSVRFSGHTPEGHYKLLTAEINLEGTSLLPNILKSLKGKLRITEGKPFGFLENAFVHPSIIKKYRLTDGQSIDAWAVEAFNPQKNEWGWKIICVNT